jgi:thioredoxin 1
MVMNKNHVALVIMSFLSAPIFCKDVVDHSIQTITQWNTLQDLIKTQPLVVVKIGASWCGGCKRVTKALQESAPSNVTLRGLEKYPYQELIHIVNVNFGTAPEITSHYNIRSIPRLLFYVNGTLFKDVTGALSRKELIDIFNLMIQELPTQPQP